MTVMRTITNEDIEQGDILMPEEEVSSLLRIGENLPDIIAVSYTHLTCSGGNPGDQSFPAAAQCSAASVCIA